eukprot:TRINITY_DN3661_c0_g1_i6.p1 TRINITY_DN3661_c0_g1~~TRINITY_DN3661_c0_g1_i6.p1  ORF type:complete len:131 (+),score=17.64 TRINITY_DN3661_c0_g1_i6:312-704(+)
MHKEFTFMLAWSSLEAARYLETYRMFENKPAKLIKERVAENHYSVLTDCLTNIRGINKTDVLTLSSTFGSFRNIVMSSMEELSLCPGLGETKVHHLYDAFHAPFDPTHKPTTTPTTAVTPTISTYFSPTT